MKTRWKQYRRVLLVGILLLSCGFIWWDNQWVLKINGQKITETEYAFYRKSNPKLDKPELQQKIIEEKVQLQQAEKQGIQTINDYKTLIRETKKINQENEEKIKKQQVVYGLRKYDDTAFYQYSFSTAITALEKKTTREITNKMILNYYEKHQAEFKEIDAKELYRVAGEQATIKQLREGPMTQEQLRTQKKVVIEPVFLNETTLRDWIKYRENELSVVNDLAVGAWSELFENASGSWSYYCLSNQEGKVQSFDTVKERITLRLEKEHYQAKVKKWVKQAQVEVK